MEFLKALLLAVVTAAVPVLTGYAVSFIRKAGTNATANTSSAIVKGYIQEITDAVSDAVEATNQTFVDALKGKGEFTKEAWAEAAQKALDACLATMRPATLEFMQRTYKDVNAYLTTRIEAEVRRQKNAAPLTLGQPVAFTGLLESTNE